jgi:hypothetical protein
MDPSIVVRVDHFEMSGELQYEVMKITGNSSVTSIQACADFDASIS